MSQVVLSGDTSGTVALQAPAIAGSNTIQVPAASGAMSIWSRTAVADVAYTVLSTDYQISYTSITASRTITLPAASSFAAGRTLAIVDESGSVSQTVQISLAPNGTDKIAGYNGTQVIINIPYASMEFVSNGVNGWFAVTPWAVKYSTYLASAVSITGTISDIAGLSVAQGNGYGTWEANAPVLGNDGSAGCDIYFKLYDGTTPISSGGGYTLGSQGVPVSLFGRITNPAGNIRVAGYTSGSNSYVDNSLSTFGRDSTLWVKRIA